MKLTKNFNSEEFDCRDGSTMPESVLKNIKLVAEQLQILRDNVGVPITINSGYRSPTYNKKVGGATKSQHLLGKACDITIKDMRAIDVYKLVINLINDGKLVIGGVGMYKNFTHLDIRKKRARWAG